MVKKNELPGHGIKHVVVLMLENRGFDHLMGWLYDEDERPHIFSHEGDERPFMGLSTMDEMEFASLANPTPRGGNLPINRGARSPKTPAYNTGETFEHIHNQMWTTAKMPEEWFDPTTRERLIAEFIEDHHPVMRGYVLDYNEDVFHNMKVRLDKDDLSEVLDTYTPRQVPVLSGLARFYAVSDEWYCSVPSQTNTNRAFSVAGTSRGMVNNSFYDPPTWNPGVTILKMIESGKWWTIGKSHADTLPSSTRCLFEVLEQANYDWKVYWQDGWPPHDVTLGVEWQYTRTMFPLLQAKQFDPNFVKFDASVPNNPFFEDARNGRLPAVSWIEPKWGGGKAWNSAIRAVGNDYHPVSDTTVGEDFVMNVYNALSSHAKWKDTLLIITFDENGGTYDHKFPPLASPSFTDACPLPEPPINRHDMVEATRTQFGFRFAQYGVRVPTMLVSPRAPKGSIFRSPDPATPFDHTSIIATILEMAGISREHWMLGGRVDAAPTFHHLLVNGPVAAVEDPADALKVPGGSHRDPLNYNTPYILQYVGDIWHAQPGALYLGASYEGTGAAVGLNWGYPTFTADPAAAVPFTFVPPGGGNAVTPILNMTNVGIRTTEHRSTRGNLLITVPRVTAELFFDNNAADPASQWQLRLLGSRDRRDEVRLGDEIFFLSQAPVNFFRKISERTMPDPMQRLMPLAPANKRATTQPGEWGLWRVLPLPPRSLDDLD